MNAATRVSAAAALENDLSKIARANSDFPDSPRRLLIDGAWAEAQSGRTFEVRDPSSDRVIGTVAEGASADVDLAVAAARRAFDDSDWSCMKPVDRERLLHRLADLIERDAESLAELEALDNGKSAVT